MAALKRKDICSRCSYKKLKTPRLINGCRNPPCPNEFTDDVQSIAALTTENVIEATVRCLRVINTDLKMSHSLPPGMSARFRIATALAQACQGAGYKGDIGYQTFLYSSEADIRKLFMFLVEKLPRKKDEAVERPSGEDFIFKRNIGRVLKLQLGALWLPSCLKKVGVRRFGIGYVIEGSKGTFPFSTDPLILPEILESGTINQDTLDGYHEKLPHVQDQLTHNNHLIPSLIEKNASDLSLHQDWETALNHSSAKNLKEHTRLEAELQANSRKGVTVNNSDLSADVLADSSFSEVINIIARQTSTGKSVLSKPEAVTQEKSKGEILAKSIENHKIVTSNELAKSFGEDITYGDGSREHATDGDMVGQKTEEEIITTVENTLDEELRLITKKIEKMESDIVKFNDYLTQAEENIKSCEEFNTAEQENVKLQKKTLSLLPNAAENIKNLEAMIEANQKKMISLNQQWDKHHVPLMEQYQELKEKMSMQQSQSERKLQEIKLVRQRIKENTEEMRQKEELEKQLSVEYGEMTREVSRKSYTKKIFEIVANIRKQKDEIARALRDTRFLQKEINQLEGRIERTFTAADDIMFTDAKSDASVRQAYKYLVSLHANCSQLLDIVESTGGVTREIRELEEQTANECQRSTAENLGKITADLEEMKRENSEMVKRLKSISSSSHGKKTKT